MNRCQGAKLAMVGGPEIVHIVGNEGTSQQWEAKHKAFGTGGRQ